VRPSSAQFLKWADLRAVLMVGSLRSAQIQPAPRLGGQAWVVGSAQFLRMRDLSRGLGDPVFAQRGPSMALGGRRSGGDGPNVRKPAAWSMANGCNAS